MSFPEMSKKCIILARLPIVGLLKNALTDEVVSV
jgi:hypothetical protein